MEARERECQIEILTHTLIENACTFPKAQPASDSVDPPNHSTIIPSVSRRLCKSLEGCSLCEVGEETSEEEHAQVTAPRPIYTHLHPSYPHSTRTSSLFRHTHTTGPTQAHHCPCYLHRTHDSSVCRGYFCKLHRCH